MPRPKIQRNTRDTKKRLEVTVPSTARDIPVKRTKVSRAARQPIPEPALDHRRQIQDDEPKRTRAK